MLFAFSTGKYRSKKSGASIVEQAGYVLFLLRRSGTVEACDLLR